VNVVGEGGVFRGVAPSREPRVIRMSNGREREHVHLFGREEGESPGEQRARVLLVEDDADSLSILCELLNSRYDVLCAQDGEQALAIAQSEQPDMMIADVYLPRMDGLALMEALRQDPRTHELPVVFLSGRREERLVVQCFERGAADFVAKPPSSRELFARIDRVVRESKRRAALEELAQTDALTGLANFRALSSRLIEEFKRAERYGHPLSAVMIDLDRLKQLNDRLGHREGNRAIAALGQQLRADLRQTDFAARYGGDEFLVLLPHHTADDAARFADRLRADVREVQLRDADGHPVDFPVTLSVGVAGHRPEAPLEGPEMLLHNADVALYEAKRRGRDQVVVFGRELVAEEHKAHPPA
jgi:two-component system cell cycle response regulator